MKLRLLSAMVADKLRQDGFLGTCRKAIKYLKFNRARDEFDAQHGVDTSGVVPLWNLDISSSNARFGVQYQPSDPTALEDAVKALGINAAETMFVDLGCGKGRMLIVAHQLGFRKLVGVEFAPELAAKAQENLRKFGIPESSVVLGDAADYIPPEEPLLVYMYNPFGEEVMAKVAERLRAHLPPLSVVYVQPKFSKLFDDSAAFQPVARFDGSIPVAVWRKNRNPAARLAT